MRVVSHVVRKYEENFLKEEKRGERVGMAYTEDMGGSSDQTSWANYKLRRTWEKRGIQSYISGDDARGSDTKGNVPLQNMNETL